MRNFSSIFRERNGRSDTTGNMISETRELATAVKEDAKLLMQLVWLSRKAVEGDELHKTNSNFKDIVA
jgi:hypothetical protein